MRFQTTCDTKVQLGYSLISGYDTALSLEVQLTIRDLFRLKVVSGKSVQLSLDDLSLNSSVVAMTAVGDGRWLRRSAEDEVLGNDCESVRSCRLRD